MDRVRVRARPQHGPSVRIDHPPAGHNTISRDRHGPDQGRLGDRIVCPGVGSDLSRLDLGRRPGSARVVVLLVSSSRLWS